jgi:predicted metal-dependent hydrolase
MYKKWLELKSEKIFHAKVGKYSKKLNIQPHRIIIKNLKNRWGSVTKEGDLNLNVNLLKAPSDVIDYIIAHELCHFVIKGHAHHFWDFLGKIMPRYKDKMVWLENNTSLLLE